MCAEDDDLPAERPRESDPDRSGSTSSGGSDPILPPADPYHLEKDLIQPPGPAEMSPELRRALLKNFREIESTPETRENFFTLSSVFLMSAILLGGVVFFRGSETPGFPDEENIGRGPSPGDRGMGSLLALGVSTSPSPSPRRTVSPTLSPSPLASPLAGSDAAIRARVEAVERDDVCAVVRGGDADVYGVLEALPEFPSLSEDLRAVVRSQEKSVARKLEIFRDLRDETGEFYEALTLGGLLSGAESPVDLQRSASLLRGLAGRFPDNAAFPYFLIAVLRRAAIDDAEIDRWISEMAGRAVFDSGVQLLTGELFDRVAPVSASRHFLVSAAMADWVTPAMVPTQKILAERLRNRPDLALTLYEGARRWAEAEVSRSSGIEFVDYSAENYAIFSGLARLAWTEMNEAAGGDDEFPGFRVGNRTLRDYRDLVELEGSQQAVAAQIYAGWTEFGMEKDASSVEAPIGESAPVASPTGSPGAVPAEAALSETEMAGATDGAITDETDERAPRCDPEAFRDAFARLMSMRGR